MKTERAIAWVFGILVGGAALAVDFPMPPASLPVPLTSHVNRFVDSTQTRNYQCCPVRTYRALKPFKYSAATDSFYTVVGNSYFKYGRANILAGPPPQPMSRVTRPDDGSGGGELYLGPSALYDKDNYNAGWPGVQDGQFFLTDFDFDDRGIHYIAYSAFGWGLLDEGFGLQWRLTAATAGQTCTATNCPDNSMIVAALDPQSGNRYALVGGPGVWGVWNVNTPTAPTFVRTVNFNGYLTRDSSGSILAATDISSTVRIIEVRDFVQGNTQGKAIGLGGSIIAAAYDGSSFWFLPFSGGSAFYKVSPPLWNATAYPVTGSTIPFFSAQVSEDYVIGADGPSTSKVRVYAIRPDGVEEVTSLTDFMESYYGPASNISHRAVTPFNYNGKTYFIWSSFSLGDVYEVAAGDSLTVTRDTAASPGTANPNAPPNTSATPFYGDRQTFKATPSGLPPTQIKWSPDYPAVAFGAGAAVATPFTHTYSGTVAATKTVRAQDVGRPDVFGTTTITLELPKARVKVPGSTTLVESGQNVGRLLTGASFYDASDGVVEGHLTDWSLASGTTASAQDPRTPFGVGPCGPRTLTFTPRYGSYAPSLSLTYEVLPIVANVSIDQAASAGANVVFLNQSTHGSGFQGTDWTETWEVLDGSNQPVAALSPPPTTAALGTVTTFSVAKADIEAGYKVRLRMSVESSVAPAGCSSQLSDEATVLLTTPDPDIVTTSCNAPTTLAGSCTLSVRSISSASQSGWTYAWYLDGSTNPASTASTYSPTFSTVGTHTVTVVATNPFGSAQDVQAFDVIAPPCNGAPPQDLISFAATQTSTRTFNFDARAFFYTFQTCDQFSWNFGDGGTATGRSATHTFAADGTYTVTLVVSNTNGSASVSNTVTVGNVTPPPPPPPPCADPTNKVYIGWTATSGCAPGLGKPPCETGEAIQFTVDTVPGFSLASCHTYSWQFGDGSGSTSRNPVKTYSSPGTYNASLTVSNGSTSATTTGTVRVEASTCGTVAPSGLEIFYSGLTSGCQADNATPCKEGETFRFGILTTGSYELEGCETIGWDFGHDGATSTSPEPNHTFPGVGPYDVLMSVRNTVGTMIAGKTVRFFDPSIPKPVVSIDPISTKAKIGSEIHFLGTFQSEAELLAINWRVIRTTFGDEVVYSASNTGDIYYTFNEIGDYRVELTATNGGGVSTPAVATVMVVEVQEYSFLIPVVVNLDGNNNTQWRTDLQIFNTDPLTGEIEFDFEFRGGAGTVTKTITMTSSTQIYEDFLGELSKPGPPLKDAGPMIVRARGDSPPQMWTRTYTVDASGNGSYGQLIPAISLDAALPSEEQVSKYVLPGLEISPRFRTNVGIVNPSSESVTVNVMARDDSALGVPIGNFDVVVPPLALVQIGDLANRIPGIGEAPFSLNIQPLGNSRVVVYGSMIDQNSNDPIYVSGILDTDQESSSKRVQLLPGTGHLEQGNGTWRSDVVVYNPDLLPVRFDLYYFDGSGTKIAEAKDQLLGNGAFMKVEDVLKWELLDNDPGNSFGILKVETNDSASPVGRYPIMYQRTYKDRDELGSFGQGIPAISPEEANVTVGHPAFIAGVRSDESYYTNLGLVAVGNEPSVVKVTLLHDGNGNPVGTWQYVVNGEVAGINPNASLIVTNIIRAISSLSTRGTLKIEVVSGGNVWAYASVIAAADPDCKCSKPEQTFDPEYVPAVKMPLP